MRLSAPKKVVFLISLVLALLGLIAQLGWFSAFDNSAFLLTFIGYLLLAAGNYFKGF